MEKNIIYTLIILLGLVGCKKTENTQRKDDFITPQTIPTEFVLPEIPAMYTDPEQRAVFLVNHYWDHFNFSDTTFLANRNVVEQAWADYINILNHVPLDVAAGSVNNMFMKADNNKTTFGHFTSLADDYLYDPNSPYRNEEFYIPVLEVMVSSSHLDEAEKIRPADRLEMAFKNRVGTRAANFSYTLQTGRQGKLDDWKTEYILLYFNNPGCHACQEITNSLIQSLQIQYLISQKKLTILAVYPDEDLDEWKKHLSDFPSDWINGYDKGETIRMQNMYDLKAIPTLYLLDKNKTVLIKDGTFEQIENFLRIANY